jgi:hypothetical protein
MDILIFNVYITVKSKTKINKQLLHNFENHKERDIDKVYKGETGRSAGLLKTLKKTKSVLYKHRISDHPHENVKFRREPASSHTRQVNEAVRPSHKTLKPPSAESGDGE